jgi:hypothetical protein
MDGDAAALDQDLDCRRKRQDLRGRPGIRRRRRVAVGLELDEGGLGNGGRHTAIGPGVDLRQRAKLLLGQHLGGRPPGRSMDPEVPLFLPGEDLGVEFLKTRAGGDAEEGLQISNKSFDAAFLVGPGDVAGVDRKSVMAGEVQKLGIEPDLRSPSDDDALEVVIAMAMGDTPYLMEGPDMAVQEKLQRVAGIKVDDRIARPGQDINEPVDRRWSELPVGPVDLSFLPRQELQLEEGLGPLFPKRHRRLLDRPVTTLVAVAPESVEHLDGHERRGRLVPLGDQPLVGRDDQGLGGPRGDRPEDPRNGLAAHPELGRDLTHRQALDFPQPPALDPARLVHHTKDKTASARRPSRLVSSPRSSGYKCRPVNTFQQYLVLYHLPRKPARYEQSHFE